MACSQLMQVHWPPTSFTGYRSRRSPCTSSRTAAPLAQCEPRLIGLSQLGSWPIHTSFCTSAVTVQPTAQCVQMLLRIATGAPGFGGGPAAALRTPDNGSAPSEARAPAASTERRRKVRRSRPPTWLASVAASVPRRLSRSVRLISTTSPPSLRISVYPVIGSHVLALSVPRLAFLLVRFGTGRFARK